VSINEQFRSRFVAELEKISSGLSKKSGNKKKVKIAERIGRVREKYPSIQKHYVIEYESDEKDVVTKITWTETKKKETETEGVYFLRTSLAMDSEEQIWQCYNTIREIEASFRCLKSDLDLRPIYHKNDDATMAHLHLGLLAYWLVNTIRFQLKKKKIVHSWTEIVRIANTQKVITTTAQKADD